MEFFFDLDGTLINIADKHYAVYKAVIRELKGKILDKKAYWELKRNKSPIKEILIKSSVNHKKSKFFLESFRRKIEKPNYLALDSVFPYTIGTLEKLSSQGHVLNLVTLRRFKNNTLSQLKHLKLLDKFQSIKIGPSRGKGWKRKKMFIAKITKLPDKIIVGDTEDDILAAKSLGATSIATLSGIRNEKQLEKNMPDFIVTNLEEIVGCIKPKHERKVSIAEPLIGKKEEKLILSVIRSKNITQGRFIEKFENNFAEYIGVKYAVATSSGTSALCLALQSLELEKGVEVITTPFSFIASSNSILYSGLKPVFVDIDEKSFNINPNLIEKKVTQKTRAILPVHLFGLPSDMKKIMAIAKKYNLWVIEDACQAHGASINGKKIGSFGTLGCFSFYATKNITTGEGGMITTNNKKLAEKMKLLRSHGSNRKYEHKILGFNFRMTDLQAAIGIEQLRKLEIFNKRRIENAKYLSDLLSKSSKIVTPITPDHLKHVFHQFTIRIKHSSLLSRETMITKLKRAGIEASIYYPIPIHKQTVYKDLGYKYILPVSEKMAKEVISLPIHPNVTKKDLEKIADIVFKSIL